MPSNNMHVLFSIEKIQPVNNTEVKTKNYYVKRKSQIIIYFVFIAKNSVSRTRTFHFIILKFIQKTQFCIKTIKRYKIIKGILTNWTMFLFLSDKNFEKQSHFLCMLIKMFHSFKISYLKKTWTTETLTKFASSLDIFYKKKKQNWDFW